MNDTKCRVTYDSRCQQDSVPQSLKTLVGLILSGTNTEAQPSTSNLIET
jgi:hypothetical protein